MPNINERIEEQRRVVRESLNGHVYRGFDPRSMPGHTPRAEGRMVAAMEFAAYQLGEINQRLAQLMELTEDVSRDRD